MATNRWTDAVDAFQKQLDEIDQKKFRSLTDKAGLKSSLEPLKRQSSALGDEKNVKLLDQVLGLLGPIAAAADALAPGACVPSSALWGAFGLIIEMASSKRESIEAILNNYNALFEASPRMESYLNDENFMSSKRLNDAIQEVFDEFLSTTAQFIKIVGKDKSSKLNFMQTLRWIRYRKVLERSRIKIRVLTEKVDEEAKRAMDAKIVQSLQAKTIQGGPSVSKSTGKKTMIPFVKNPAFSGRSGHLEEIHARLNPKAVLESREQQSFVLYGLGGVGKTQLALHYAHLYIQEYDTCFWITCDNGAKISKDVAKMARMLSLGDEGRDNNSAAVNEWMSTTEQNWLLILDNVESPKDVQDIWPSCGRGSILVTTQDSGWRSREDIKHSIKVKPMFRDEGVSMVMDTFSRNKRPISEDDAQRIFDVTGGLPLCIRQLCSYICATDSDLDKFLLRYHRDTGRIDRWDAALPPFYEYTLDNFLDMTLSRLSGEDLSLVNLFCFLDPDNIPSKLLCDPLQADEFEDSADNLCRYSLISRTEDADDAYNIHRAVKRYLLNHLNDEQLGDGLESLTLRMRKLLPRQTPWADEASDVKWEHSDLISHIVALNKEFQRVSSMTRSPEVLAQTLLDGAFDLWIKGVLDDGQDLIDSAVKLSSREGFDQILAAEISSFQGTILADSGEIDMAHEAFAKAHDILKLRRTGTFTDEIYLANSFNNLAGIYCAKGEYREAVVHSKVSIYLKEKWRNSQQDGGRSLSHLLCLSYQNLAHALAKLGDYREAEVNFERALREGKGEVSAVRRGLTYHNYGCMRMEEGRYDEACGLLKMACEERESALDNHPDTAVSLCMLAVCTKKANEGSKAEKWQEARELLVLAVGILERRRSILNKKRLARTTYGLSMVLKELKDPQWESTLKKAEKLYFDITGEEPVDESSYDGLVPYI